MAEQRGQAHPKNASEQAGRQASFCFGSHKAPRYHGKAGVRNRHVSPARLSLPQIIVVTCLSAEHCFSSTTLEVFWMLTCSTGNLGDTLGNLRQPAWHATTARECQSRCAFVDGNPASTANQLPNLPAPARLSLPFANYRLPWRSLSTTDVVYLVP